MRWLWGVLRAGAQVGINTGVFVGLIAGFGGSLLTSSLPALAEAAANVFLILAILLPLVFYTYLLRYPVPAQQAQVYAAVAWLAAVLFSVVLFMMPVVLIPFVLGEGITLESSADWYSQVLDLLGGWRLLIVGVMSAVGFILAASRAPKAAP